jgi:hypothetical protein
VNVVTVVADFLRAIPDGVRSALLRIYAGVVIVVAVSKIFHADLPYAEINETLVYIGGYLGIQSAANVGQTTDPPAEVNKPLGGDVDHEAESHKLEFGEE